MSIFRERCGAILVPLLLSLFLFFTPISPSLKSVFFFWSIITIILSPQYNHAIFSAYTTPWGYSSLALFFFIVIACMWSPAPYSSQLSMIWKYSKLVYLPILAVGFMHVKNRYLAINNGRYWAINSYLAAICLTCILTFLKSKGLIHLHPEWDQSAVFYNYIITGFMVSFGSYIAGLYFFQSKSWWSKSVYLCIWLLTSFHILFINSGRTGHILYIVLMLLLITQTLSFKQSLLGFVIFTCVLCLCYQHSQVMHNGVNLFLTEIKLLKQNDKASSLGHRIQFHNYAKSLFVQHPIAGIGTGGFRQQFYLDNPVPSWGKEITEPHSQYWMTMVEQGTIGIVLLLMFLASLLLTSLKLKETRSLLIGIFVAFCIGSFSDTILCFSAAGYLLIVISALGFGELLEHTDYVPNRFTFKTILLR